MKIKLDPQEPEVTLAEVVEELRAIRTALESVIQPARSAGHRSHHAPAHVRISGDVEVTGTVSTV